MNTEANSLLGIKDQFSIKLNPNLKRPVIYIDGLAALIDTGAEIPVLSVDKEYIIDCLKGKIIIENCSISGFGGYCSGQVFEIEKLELGKLIFPNIKVFVPNEKIDGFDLIISATMLHGLDYDINTKTHTLTITVPQNEQLIRNVSIESKDGQLIVLLNGVRVDDKYKSSFTNFSQFHKEYPNIGNLDTSFTILNKNTKDVLSR